MTIQDKIAELPVDVKPGTDNDVREIMEDIYYQFGKLEGFEILKIDRTSQKEIMVKALCLTTISDPFFKIIVEHTWKTDLAFDNEWHVFSSHDNLTKLQFLTWQYEYLSGEIWFERAKREVK